jgi:hypothetical protein
MQNNYANRSEECDALVRPKVDALPNLTDAQRAKVFEIASAHAFKNHREPNYEGIANMVRGNPAFLQ